MLVGQGFCIGKSIKYSCGVLPCEKFDITRHPPGHCFIHSRRSWIGIPCVDGSCHGFGDPRLFGRFGPKEVGKSASVFLLWVFWGGKMRFLITASGLIFYGVDGQKGFSPIIEQVHGRYLAGKTKPTDRQRIG